MKRRELLEVSARSAAALGCAKALHNTVAGFGHVGIGENLRSQQLDELITQHMSVPRSFETTLVDTDVRVMGETVHYSRDDGWQPVDADAPAAVASFDAGINALRAGEVSFTYMNPDRFFELLASDEPRDQLVQALRGSAPPIVDPSTVKEFAGAGPRTSEDMLGDLVDAFRKHTRYDVPRYLAGSIDDNLVPIDVDLRRPFRPTVSFETLLEAEDPIGFFCGEYTRLARMAVRSVPACEQSPPLYGMFVHDRRHKHVYNAFGSVRKISTGFDLPITFIDYTHPVGFDDVGLADPIGIEYGAYDTWHRADEITW